MCLKQVKKFYMILKLKKAFSENGSTFQSAMGFLRFMNQFFLCRNYSCLYNYIIFRLEHYIVLSLVFAWWLIFLLSWLLLNTYLMNFLTHKPKFNGLRRDEISFLMSLNPYKNLTRKSLIGNKNNFIWGVIIYLIILKNI